MGNTTSVVDKGYWEKIFSNRTWGQYPPEELVRFIARNFKATTNKSEVRVLEIGCGPGPNIWYLVREGFSVAGIDGSETAIRQAQDRLFAENLPYHEPQVDLKVGDFSNLPWSDNSFDSVIDVEALYANTWIDIKRTLSEIKRTLKPDGLFFGKMFGDQTTGSDSGVTIESGTVQCPTVGPCKGNDVSHFFSRNELDVLFSGFSNVEIDQVQRTEDCGVVQIFEWLVKARK
jgi:SAM-dependent methyltransferase